MGVDREDKIQWHQAFVGAVCCELDSDRDKLDIIPEKSLTKKPLQVDLLIVKKLTGGILTSRMGKLLSDYNILEYKSPGDALGIDALFQALTYACYYKSSADHEDERKDSDITVMLVRNGYPETLVRYLQGKGCSITESESGICRVSGIIFFNLVILVSGRMDVENYTWLNGLRSGLKSEGVARLARKKDYIKDRESAEAVLEVVEKVNADVFRGEESTMPSIIMEAERKAEQRGEQRGKQRGRQELLQELKAAGVKIPDSFLKANGDLTKISDAPSKMDF